MPADISRDDAQYALELVEKICAQVGPGRPGSRQERERAAMVQEELAAHLGPENVTLEEFTFAPDAFLASLPLSAGCMLLAALLNVAAGRLAGGAPWVAATALAFSILSLGVVVVEFILGREFIDSLFPHQRSVNVIGRLRRPGTQVVKRLLIVSGHHDSALENTWFRFLGYGAIFLSATWWVGLLVLPAVCLVQLAGLVAGEAGLVRAGTLGWILLAYPVAPASLYAAFFNRGRTGGGNVPGAADNLSACALAVTMSRYLAHNPACIPADTEIRFITFGAEEAGLRGSRRYVARHLDELKSLDARLLNFETVAHPEITILSSDMNGRVKNSPQMVNELAAAARSAGVPYRVKPASPGVANDSAFFSQAGLQAVTLLPFQMPQQLVAFYHQKWDTPAVLTLEPLWNVLKLTLAWIEGRGA
ncbi:MAG: M28 family peptidase [Anaerolineaceae bacterium]|nr:M28 family peptidase [Anaerolineaceae bacterium]